MGRLAMGLGVQRTLVRAPMDAVVDQFADLFEGRHDAVGTEEGGCARTVGHGPTAFRQLVLAHLEGKRPIGVYPMVYRPPCSHEMGWCVKWGAVDCDLRTPSKPSGDFDTEAEVHAASSQLVVALKQVGVTGWLERTRSGGRHVWVFAETWVPAKTMRNALLVACGVAQHPTREVNPKQVSLPAGSVGNYVRVMYPGSLARPDVVGGTDGGRGFVPHSHQAVQGHDVRNAGRSVGDDRSRRGGASDANRWRGDWAIRTSPSAAAQTVLAVERAATVGRCGADDDAVSDDGRTPSGDYSGMPRRVALDSDGSPIALAEFCEAALASRVATATLEKIAAKYKEPEKPKFDYTPPLRITSSMPWQRLNAAGKYIWANGPADGDRSRALGYLAYQARLSGLTQTETYALLQSCGFNKFAGRNDEEIRLQQIVMGAWA